MLTRCPTCTTTFRVTPEQLKVRAGRVRCGRCDTRFNALDALQEEPPQETLDQSVVIPAAVLEAHPPADAADPLVRKFPDEISTPDAGRTQPDHLPAEVTESSRAAAEIRQSLAEFLLGKPETAEPEIIEPSVPDNVPAIGMAIDEPQATDWTTEAPAESLRMPESIAAEPGDLPAEVPLAEIAPAPGMSRPIRHATFDEWQDESATAARRWPWIAGSVIAVAALIAQAALHYRVEIAVLQPQLKPLLISACKLMGCSVSLPRKAEFLGIESSDLHPDPDHPGHLLLSSTLKNRAPFAQEFPLLEVTLNDVADHPLIIKDLKPDEYLPTDMRPAKGFGVNGEIAVNLTLDVGDVPAAGYRLYLFYP